MGTDSERLDTGTLIFARGNAALAKFGVFDCEEDAVVSADCGGTNGERPATGRRF